MPTLTYRYAFLHYRQPVIHLGVRSPLRDVPGHAFAFVDTGAEISLFDLSIARQLGLDLAASRTVSISGVGGFLREELLAEVTVDLLSEPDLSTTLEVAFAPDVEALHGNLLGLDVLENFDFALSHAQRVGYLEKASP